MNVVPNQEATLGQIQSGEMNFLWEWPGDPSVLQSIVTDNEHLDLFSAISIGMNYFAFNVRYAPFDDVNFVRRLRIRFRSSSSSTISSMAWRRRPTVSFRPRWSSGGNATICRPMTYSIEGARALLEGAGYSWDDEGRLHYPGNWSRSGADWCRNMIESRNLSTGDLVGRPKRHTIR